LVNHLCKRHFKLRCSVGRSGEGPLFVYCFHLRPVDTRHSTASGPASMFVDVNSCIVGYGRNSLGPARLCHCSIFPQLVVGVFLIRQGPMISTIRYLGVGSVLQCIWHFVTHAPAPTTIQPMPVNLYKLPCLPAV